MKLLLIYELIPEDTKFYVFENVKPTDELFLKLNLANGHYVNYTGEHGDNEGTEFLNSHFADLPALPLEDLPKSGPFDAVFHSGYGL